MVDKKAIDTLILFLHQSLPDTTIREIIQQRYQFLPKITLYNTVKYGVKKHQERKQRC